MNNVKEWVINWFVNSANCEREKVEENFEQNYIEVGLVDSFGFLQLIADIEEMGTILSDKDFENEALFTINGLIAILEERLS